MEVWISKSFKLKRAIGSFNFVLFILALLKETALDSREGSIVIDSIKKSLWNPDAIVFEFINLQLVNNERLEAEVRKYGCLLCN